MEYMNSLWNRQGNYSENYPGIQQSEVDSCLFASIAGAANYLTKSQRFSEQSMQMNFQKQHLSVHNFETAIKCIDDASLTFEIFRDEFSNVPAAGLVQGKLDDGSVVILSLEIANGPLGKITRSQVHHMISIFKNSYGVFQVWDTAGKKGLITQNELSNLVSKDELALPDGQRFLMPHDRHELLCVQPAW